MSSLVVDASVIVAVAVDDPLSSAARSAMDDARTSRLGLEAPELIVSETANALWKAVQRKQVAAADATAAMSDALALRDLRLHPLEALGPRALETALALGITAYDAFYVALAIEIDSPLSTGDRRLADRAREGGVSVKLVSASAP